MSVTENLVELEQALEAWLSLKDVVGSVKQRVEIQEARDSLCVSLFQMNEFAQTAIKEWKYDTLMWDTNGLIDQVQKDLAEMQDNLNLNEIVNEEV